MSTRLVRVLFGLLLCFGCGKDESSEYGPPKAGVEPAEAFRLFAGLDRSDAVPAGVTSLQADGAVWQDFIVCCRFNAPRDVIQSIVTSGYGRTEWTSLKSVMFPLRCVESFSPKWNPAGLVTKKCYIKRTENDESTVTLYLVVDDAVGCVYAVGRGRPKLGRRE
jgi:hypothetical protein